MAGNKLDKLRDKRDALNAQIRASEQRERNRGRKTDTRRKVLAGAAVLALSERDPTYRSTLWTLLSEFLTRSSDRSLFDLPPLPKSSEAED